MRSKLHLWVMLGLAAGSPLALGQPTHPEGDNGKGGTAWPHQFALAKTPAWFDTAFEFGQNRAVREGSTILIQAPATLSAPKTQMEVRSKFELAGDFQVQIDYELLDLPKPQSGYGMSAGIGAGTAFESVFLIRGRETSGEQTYTTGHLRRQIHKDVYDLHKFPANAVAGRLLIRRFEKLVEFLVSDTADGTWRRLDQFTFPPPKQLRSRAFVDSGGELQSLSVRFSRFQVEWTGLDDQGKAIRTTTPYATPAVSSGMPKPNQVHVVERERPVDGPLPGRAGVEPGPANASRQSIALTFLDEAAPPSKPNASEPQKPTFWLWFIGIVFFAGTLVVYLSRFARISRPRAAAQRRGFSLIELVVAIGIIGVLASLLLPAVQSVRRSASQAVCTNNLRQIGIALQSFHDTNHVFPSNGGWDGVQKIKDASGTPFTPETFDKEVNQLYRWGVGDPTLAPAAQTGSWAYSILPLIEQDNAFRQRAQDAAVPTYLCPARNRKQPQSPDAEDIHGRYLSGGLAWSKIDYAVNLQAFANRPTVYAMNRFTDGLSNTALVGEKAIDPLIQTPTSWYWDEPYFIGGSKGGSRGGVALYQDAPGIPYKDSWGSRHAAGVPFVFGDGSVRVINYRTPWDVLLGLLTPSGGEVVNEP